MRKVCSVLAPLPHFKTLVRSASSLYSVCYSQYDDFDDEELSLALSRSLSLARPRSAVVPKTFAFGGAEMEGVEWEWAWWRQPAVALPLLSPPRSGVCYACEWARLPFEADTEHGISPRGSHCRRTEERKNLTQSFLPLLPSSLSRSICSRLIQAENRRAFAKEASSVGSETQEENFD